MFVAAPITRIPKKLAERSSPDAEQEWDHVYPVLWENQEYGYTHEAIAFLPNREEAETLAAELNSLLTRKLND